jgi:hypothetical protein
MNYEYVKIWKGAIMTYSVQLNAGTLPSDTPRPHHCISSCGCALPGEPPSGSWWPLHRVSMKIQKKKTVTENVYI